MFEWKRTVVATILLLTVPQGAECFGQYLQMGMDGVAWENSNDQGPLLYRSVPEASFVSVRAKISGQTSGFWSQAGVMVRLPNPIDAAPSQENWMTSWSFRAPDTGPFTHQSNMVTNGTEAELNTGGLTAADLAYVRIDNMGSGIFQAYRGTGPDNSITWTPIAGGTQTNANLSGATLQIGLAAGAIGALPGASTVFDWAEIQTTTQTYRDDFNYTQDFSTGVPGFNAGATSGGAIWNAIENATAGGTPTKAGANLARCVSCTWSVNGSGNLANAANWGVGNLFSPNGTDNTVVFGNALTGTAATVFTNSSITLKEIDFDNAIKYVLAGPGTVTLDTASGSALINTNSGSHEIQTKLSLGKNVTATTAAGATLNINAPVYLNGHTFTVSGTGTTNLNDGTVLVGSGAGAGSFVNEGDLSGLGAVEGNFSQSGSGSLALLVGGDVLNVSGAAELGGVLDVSLASGFVPQAGQSYTVLTADSVSNLGLSLSGSAAGLFTLVVGPNSVSLTAVPEPAALALLSCGLAAATLVRRRRLVHRSNVTGGVLRLLSLSAVVMLVASVAQASVLGPSGTTPVTFRDEFTGFYDYANGGGAAPASTLVASLGANGSWTGIFNQQNGGDASNPAILQANGADFNGVPQPGVLYMEDLVLHPNTDGQTGIGWEGDKTSAPFLYTNVDSTNDFDATIKINTQTNGNWSYSGMIARRAGPTPGQGVGDTLDPTESFLTMGSFRTTTVDDPATPAVNETLNATILSQNIINTVETENNGGGVFNGLPLWVRMSKQGSQFTAYTSTDGTTFTMRNSVINPQLSAAAPGTLLQVGPSFMMFTSGGAAVYGNTTFDFFEITVKPGGRQLDNYWNPTDTASASGDWNDGTNWGSDTKPGTVPNVNSTDVTLGLTATHPNPNATTGPATVYNNSVATIRSLTFNSPNKYSVSGAGSITLEPDAQSLIDTTATYIHTVAGSHEIQLPMGLSAAASAANNKAIADSGTQLDINNSLDLNGKRLTIQGAGKVNINSNIDLATTGSVLVSGGNLGGSGRINGTLQNGDGTVANPGGTISPGTSIGTLTVDGTGTGNAFTQATDGVIKIELGGTTAGQFDVLKVLNGNANLRGKVDVSLANGFVPAVNNQWEIMTVTGSILSSGFVLDASDSPYYTLTVSSANHNVILKLVNALPAPGVQGDYNGNGIVDAADYTLWRDHLGQTFQLSNEGTGQTPGIVTIEDYNFWKSRFGATSGSGSLSGAIPEPCSLALLLCAGVILGRGIIPRSRRA